MEKLKRTFIAIPLEPVSGFIAFLNRMQEEFKNEKFRWVPWKNMHLTLTFIGPTPENLEVLVQKAISKTTEESTHFDLELMGLGIFPSPQKPRVLWVGIRKAEKLIQLRETLIMNLREYGVSFESENKFIPHLSLARMKWLDRKEEMIAKLEHYKNHHFQVSQVEKIHYFESKLKPKGPVYRSLGEYLLKSRRGDGATRR